MKSLQNDPNIDSISSVCVCVSVCLSNRMSVCVPIRVSFFVFAYPCCVHMCSYISHPVYQPTVLDVANIVLGECLQSVQK